jgi:alanyl-tRNA synthetase
VYEDEVSGAVVHIVAGSLESPHVHGVVDMNRRRDHIQQHSGQHVLSRAFLDLFALNTVSFHMGEATSTIDLADGDVSEEQLAAAEDLANRAVLDDRPVSVRYVASEDSGGLRKPIERTGPIRLIDIDGFDRSACGGTHVQRSGEIGQILIVAVERVRKQARVHFVCGARALRHARSANRSLDDIARTLSVGAADCVRAVRVLAEDHQRARKRVEELETRLLDYEADRLAASGGEVVAAFKNRGIEALKLLGLKVCSRSGAVALLADESDQLRVVFARSQDRLQDMAALLRQVTERFGGRGGGRPSLAQAGGLTGNAEEVLAFARSLLKE